MRAFIAVAVAMTATVSVGQEFSDLVKTVRRSVVRVEATGHGVERIGSGFVVRADGVIATSYHVIGEATEGKVVFEDGRTFTIQGVMADQQDHGMAILKVDAEGEPLDVLEMASRLPEQGQDVFTFSDQGGLRFAVSCGIVNAVADTAEIAAGNADLGEELRRDYSLDAVWIQTDAPISAGNIGGPLIDKDGQVVGVNTWFRAEWRNMNYAGSVLTLHELLHVSTEQLRPLPRAHPGASAVPRMPEGPIPSGFPTDRVALPTGAVFDFAIFSSSATILSDTDRRRLQVSGAFSIPYPSGKPFALLQHSNGKLHGLCWAQHENGKPMMIGHYERGERSGNFRIASNDGRPLLDAQFSRGDKEGFTCFYKEGVPALVQECSKGKPSWSHRIVDFEVVESFEHKSKTAPPPPEGIGTLLAELEEFEKRIKTNEVAVKKTVRELEEDIRKQRAAARGAATQQMIQSRINARAAENQRLIEALHWASRL